MSLWTHPPSRYQVKANSLRNSDCCTLLPMTILPRAASMLRARFLIQLTFGVLLSCVMKRSALPRDLECATRPTLRELCCFTARLNCLQAVLRASFSSLETILSRHGAILGRLRTILGRLGSTLGHVGGLDGSRRPRLKPYGGPREASRPPRTPQERGRCMQHCVTGGAWESLQRLQRPCRAAFGIFPRLNVPLV